METNQNLTLLYAVSYPQSQLSAERIKEAKNFMLDMLARRSIVLHPWIDCLDISLRNSVLPIFCRGGGPGGFLLISMEFQLLFYH